MFALKPDHLCSFSSVFLLLSSPKRLQIEANLVPPIEIIQNDTKKMAFSMCSLRTLYHTSYASTEGSVRFIEQSKLGRTK